MQHRKSSTNLEPALQARLRALALAPDLAAIELLALDEPEILAPLRLRIRDLLRRVDRAERGVRESETIRAESLATLAHELKTPLTAIRGYAKLMSEGDTGAITPQQAEYLSIIQESVVRVVKIADEALTGARDLNGEGPFAAAEGAAPGARDRIELGGLLRELEQTTRVLVPSQLVLHFDVASVGEGLWLRGHRLHLFQALLNLVTNALKYTERGEVRVSAQLDSRDPAQPRICIRVRDTGIGIPTEEQARVFERFYRAKQARELGLPGLGLGLSMTRQWVEDAQGWISLWSEPGKGSEFTVELPCEGA